MPQSSASVPGAYFLIGAVGRWAVAADLTHEPAGSFSTGMAGIEQRHTTSPGNLPTDISGALLREELRP
jgi:hypothetical protein